MTQQEFDSLRINFMYKYSDICNKLVQKMRLGSSIDKEFYTLLVLDGYLNIFMEYTPEDISSDSINFFNRTDMSLILEKTNELTDSSFYVDFILQGD